MHGVGAVQWYFFAVGTHLLTDYVVAVEVSFIVVDVGSVVVGDELAG